MFQPKSLMHYIRRPRQNSQRPNRCQPRGLWFWKSAWPRDVLHTPFQTEVITWNCYLTEDIRDALLDIYAGDRTDEQFAAAARSLESRSFKDRVRIAHFDWTYTSYTVPDWPTYCVWLTRDEIRARVFPSPVPPFMAIAYDRLKQMFRRIGVHDAELTRFLFAEERMLQASQLLWKPEHFAIVQFYKTLAYNIKERHRRDRWVQEDY